MARDKAEKFVELASKRVTKAIKDMRLIANLSNRSNYEFTDEQAKKIVKAIQKEADAVRSAFSGKGGTNDDVFKF